MDPVRAAVQTVFEYEEPVIVLVGIALTLYAAYGVWEDRADAKRWYASHEIAWQLAKIPLSVLVGHLILGALWRRFIELPWYGDLAILLGVYAVLFVASTVWLYFIGKGLPDDLNKAAAMGSMIKDPVLDSAWRALDQDDFGSAREILLTLAEEGNAAAQLNLGILYEAGLGVRESADVAEMWYRKAADSGLREAQYQIAAILAADVMGGTANVTEQEASERLIEGYMWAYLAALKNHDDAKKAVKRIGKCMSEHQIQTAERMAAQRLANGNGP